MERQAMTRAERKTVERARLARVATMTFAKQKAKRLIQAEIKARGDRVSDYSNKDLTLMAEALIQARPELVVEARQAAASMGYGV
jgi:hypothetical protein